jgi:hypothetical protein
MELLARGVAAGGQRHRQPAFGHAHELAGRIGRGAQAVRVGAVRLAELDDEVEGDAAVEDLMEILSVDEAKAREIHEAVHQEAPAAQ